MKAHEHLKASFFLVLFSIIQIVDLHKMNHDQEHIDCTICCLVSDDLHDEFVLEGTISVTEVVAIGHYQQVNNYFSPFISVSGNASFLNKAPPIT